MRGPHRPHAGARHDQDHGGHQLSRPGTPRWWAYIGVRADLRHLAETARAIADLDFVRFVATMIGRYDILVITLVRDGGELVRLVNEEIMTLPGVPARRHLAGREGPEIRLPLGPDRSGTGLIVRKPR